MIKNKDGNEIHNVIIFKLDTLQECINKEIKPKLDEIQKNALVVNIATERNTTNIKWITWIVRLVILSIITSSFFIYRNFSMSKCIAQEETKIERSK